MITIPIENFINNLKRFKAMEQTGFPNTKEAFVETMHEVRNYWKMCAGGNISLPGITPRFRSQYIAAIDAAEAYEEIETANGIKIVIEPDPDIAKRAENHIPPYDLKPGILKGPHSKRYDSQNRVYKYVPLRHGAPGSSRFPSMPKEIYNLIGPDSEKKPHLTIMQDRVKFEKNQFKRSASETIRIRGDRLTRGDLPNKYQEPEKAQFLKFNKQSNSFIPTQYQHKTPKYQGMVRMEKLYEVDTQAQYVSWRYVGAKSDPNSWWHPGFKHNPISYHVRKKAREMLTPAIAKGLSADLALAMESGYI